KQPPPPPPRPAPPRYISSGDPAFIGPRPLPPPPPPPQPPVPNFQVAGIFGSPESPVAALVEGDHLELVRHGDTFRGKFMIRQIGYESVDVGFVGFPREKMTRVAITAGKK